MREERTEEVSKKLKQLRERNKFSQGEIAGLINVGQFYLCKNRGWN